MVDKIRKMDCWVVNFGGLDHIPFVHRLEDFSVKSPVPAYFAAHDFLNDR